MNAIEVQNLSKHFTLRKKRNSNQKKKGGKQQISANQISNGVLRAVDMISFIVKRGEIFGLLGPNGAGKTTTIRMLTGVLQPTKGEITVFGKRLRKNKLLIQQIMGHVPEMANAYLDLTGMQNLELIGELYSVPKKEREKRAELLLKKFELFGRRDSKAKNYSKGMKQRLLLCMALMSEPEILFLDEPTAGLDVPSSLIIKDLIREYNSEGMTIILTTHDLDVANELCDRIAIVNKGKIIGLDTPENLRKLKQEYLAIDVSFDQQVEKEVLEQFENVKEVQERPNYYHIIVHHLNQAICEVTDYVKSHGLQITKLTTYEPKLEEVFLKMINGGNKE
ncbi:MAG: ATP-binding cassette domain-containing protein [Candidatus Heimdallarchaeota archaeon]|nr:ATP-binding cassette domain-containing protein [Candidatus Heimdallarchaeota archaeon]